MDITTADQFHSSRGNLAWKNAEAGEKSAAILRAEDYIEAFYQLKPDTEQHPARQKATALLALEFITEGPVLKQDREVIKFKENTASLIEEETTYGDTPSDPYPMITALLRPIMAGGSGGLRAMRVVR